MSSVDKYLKHRLNPRLYYVKTISAIHIQRINKMFNRVINLNLNQDQSRYSLAYIQNILWSNTILLYIDHKSLQCLKHVQSAS